MTMKHDPLTNLPDTDAELMKALFDRMDPRIFSFMKKAAKDQALQKFALKAKSDLDAKIIESPEFIKWFEVKSPVPAIQNAHPDWTADQVCAQVVRDFLEWFSSASSNRDMQSGTGG